MSPGEIMRRQGDGVRTVARDSGESNVQVDGELFASTSVNHNRGVNVDPSVVKELYRGEREDDSGGDEGHCTPFRCTVQCDVRKQQG